MDSEATLQVRTIQFVQGKSFEKFCKILIFYQQNWFVIKETVLILKVVKEMKAKISLQKFNDFP